MLNPAYATVPVAPRPDLSAVASASRDAITAILTPADILLDLDTPTKERAFAAIARFVSARHGLLAGEVHASLLKRETIGSTALGCGVAVPHARMKGLSRPIIAFVRMKIAIPFDAPDGKPVSDLLVILVPQHATEAHLQLLAEVAEMLYDVSFREELRACANASALHAALSEWRQH